MDPVNVGSNKETANCIIKPRVGLNNIIVGKSTLDDVRKEFGPNTTYKKWVKAIEVEIIGHYDYYVTYVNSGYSFSTYRSGKKKITEIITLDSTCKCKTISGVGIGSSYDDLKKELGQPVLNSNHKNGSGQPLMYFETYEQNEYNMVIWYGNNMRIILNGTDTTKSHVTQIIFSADPVY